MGDVRDLRPYLDVFVNDALDGVASPRADVSAPRRKPWRLIVVALIVAVGLVLAVVSIRSVSSREGSVRVPPAQQVPDYSARVEDQCPSTGSKRVFDHATGQVIEVPAREFCDRLVDANGFSQEELQEAGIVTETSYSNGKMNAKYLEANVTLQGNTTVVEVTSVVVPLEEVQRRVAAVRAAHYQSSSG